MRMRRVALLLAALLLVGASSESRDFGAGVTLAGTTPLADILAAPERYAADPVVVEGRIADVCQKKGCWTVLTDGKNSVRVRFQDYGFFLPKDALGATALVQGVVVVRTLSEKEARHYAAESRDGDPSAIHGEQREIGFVASGVRLTR
jgi:hypothetical protein